MTPDLIRGKFEPGGVFLGSPPTRPLAYARGHPPRRGEG